MLPSTPPSLTPRPVPSLTTLKTWDSLDLILYLTSMYRDHLDDDVYQCLRRYGVTGSWFLYLREEDYINWKFTPDEAKILVHEARLIEGSGRESLVEEIDQFRCHTETVRMRVAVGEGEKLGHDGNGPPREQRDRSHEGSPNVRLSRFNVLKRKEPDSAK